MKLNKVIKTTVLGSGSGWLSTFNEDHLQVWMAGNCQL